MIDGLLTPAIKDMDEVMPHAPYPIYPSGLKDGEKSYVRYGAAENQNPTLTIIDPIFAKDGTPVIFPGHYILALSDDRNFILLIQGYSLIARIPVFQLEEDKSEAQKIYDKKEQRKSKKEKNKAEKIAKKYDEFGLKPKEPYVYSNAEIEFVPEKSYFLIKYEKGSVRAWGAIKQDNY